MGRTIIDVLNDQSRHEFIALSRKAVENAVAVNYMDVESLTEVLESNGVEVVISALAVMDETASQGQINLIKASEKSSTTTRFVASTWGFPLMEEDVAILSFMKFKFDAVEELKKTNLEWTRFHNGYFLDYYGLPHVKSYQPNISFVMDMQSKVAAIPGDGNTPVVFTYTYDVAKFVVASLDLPKWDDEFFVIGDKLTWNEFVRLAEETRGSKFEVHYDGTEKLKSGKITELPSHIASYSFFPKEMLQPLYAAFGLLMATGRFNMPEEKTLNKKFPEIKTLKAKELLEQAWKSK